MTPRSKKVLMFAYKRWNGDPRIQRELGALVADGFQVDFICTHIEREPPPVTANVSYYSLFMQKRRSSTIRYIFEYLSFCLWVFFLD